MSDTTEEVISRASFALVEHLRGRIGFTVEKKEDSPIMRAVALGMDIGRIFVSAVPAGNDFMSRYATTIGTTIYLPESVRNDPLAMLDVITHEAEHVLQFQETGLEFAWFYLSDQAARAQFEANAYAAGAAVTTWLTGMQPKDTIPTILGSLVDGYHLRPSDSTYAEGALRSLMESVAAGVITTKAGRMATEFLEANFPELKGAI